MKKLLKNNSCMMHACVANHNMSFGSFQNFMFDSTNSKPVLTPDTLPVSDMHRTTPFTSGPSTRHPFSFLAMDVTVNAQLQEPRFAFALNLEAGESTETRETHRRKLMNFWIPRVPRELPVFVFSLVQYRRP